jgi:hypothetical protein
MTKLYLVFAGVTAVAACTDGPSVAGHWDTTENWGDGNCNQDFTWYMVVHVEVKDAAGASLALHDYRCHDDGFEIDVPGGSTALDVEVTPVWHQDATYAGAPILYAVPGPVRTRLDLGKLALVFREPQ